MRPIRTRPAKLTKSVRIPFFHQTLDHRKRLALLTTVKEDSTMAVPAISGLSSRLVKRNQDASSNRNTQGIVNEGAE
jgi:hypothetical protein